MDIFQVTSLPPSSLMDSTLSPNVKTIEGEGVGACSLARSISQTYKTNDTKHLK
jgi:hypothetical protein